MLFHLQLAGNLVILLVVLFEFSNGIRLAYLLSSGHFLGIGRWRLDLGRIEAGQQDFQIPGSAAIAFALLFLLFDFYNSLFGAIVVAEQSDLGGW